MFLAKEADVILSFLSDQMSVIWGECYCPYSVAGWL